MKEQIILLGGGLSFRDIDHAKEFYKKSDIDYEKNYKSWKEWLSWSLENIYDFIIPKMPTRDNANYEIWKIIFEKYLEKYKVENPIIIAHSLGTIFILKYLVENNFDEKIKVKIRQLHLVSPIVSNNFQQIHDTEDTGTFTFDIEEVSNIKKLADEIHVWHSVDDELCDFKNAEFLIKEIPGSILHKFEDRGHFSQSTFLELFDLLRELSRNK